MFTADEEHRIKHNEPACMNLVRPWHLLRWESPKLTCHWTFKSLEPDLKPAMPSGGN